MRRLAGRSVSGLGFGGYRISSAVREHRAALIAALDHGASVVDTSPNYADGGSETLIGSVLAGRRECRPVVVTKVGTLQGEQLADAVAREQAGNPWPDVVKMSASAWVCLAPEFIAHSLAGSTQRLGAPPDVVLLHNPELVLADMHRRGALSDAAIDSFYERMLPRAFAALEAQLPGLSCYGVSANTTGCRWGALGGANEREALDLRRTLDAAAKAAKAASLEGGGGGGRDGGEARGGRGGGEAQHRCRVLQMPLNLLEPDAAAAPAALARRLGLSVMTNRPLHAIPPPGAGHGFGLNPSFLPLRDGRPTPPAAALVRQQARQVLSRYVGPAAAARLPLEEIALRFALSAPDVDVVLCGARRPEYARQVFGLLELPREAFDDLAAEMRLLMADWASAAPTTQAHAAPAANAAAHTAAAAAPPAALRRADGASRRPRAAGARHLSSSSGDGGGGGGGRGGGGTRGQRPPSGPAYVWLPASGDLVLEPASDGGPLRAVGSGDRGMGLIYRAGRVRPDAAKLRAGRAGREGREGRWVVKVQPPLDRSSDSRGGMGRMTPATLLLHDEGREWVAYLREEATGHGALLRRALRSRTQVCYLYAEYAEDASGKDAVRVDVQDEGPGDLGW